MVEGLIPRLILVGGCKLHERGDGEEVESGKGGFGDGGRWKLEGVKRCEEVFGPTCVARLRLWWGDSLELG